MITNIIANVEQYLSLRRFTDDTLFQLRLQQLQAWQRARMSETYWVMFESPELAELVEFFLNDIYSGINLSKVGNRLTKTAKLIDKLFDDLTLVDTGIEFNTLTSSLDDQMTSQLFENLSVKDIDEENYIVAFQAVGQLPLRHRQIELIVNFSKRLHEVLQDPSVYRTIKLAKYPAKLGGLGDLHGLVERGLKAIRAVPDSEPLIESIMQHQNRIYTEICAGNPKPFIPYSAL